MSSIHSSKPNEKVGECRWCGGAEWSKYTGSHANCEDAHAAAVKAIVEWLRDPDVWADETDVADALERGEPFRPRGRGK